MRDRSSVGDKGALWRLAQALNRAFAEMVKGARLPVYALGGIDAAAAPLIAHSGAVGLAAVEGVLSEYGR